MAWHNRYVVQPAQSQVKERGTRSSIVFRRKDLLWVSPTTLPLPFPLPVKVSERFLVGVNVLDVLKRERIKRFDSEGNPVEETIWRLRPSSEFFALVEDKASSKAAADVPLRIGLSTGGIFLEDRGSFILISKRSSVSISTLVYRLAVGMTGSETAASQQIGLLASAAWEQDIIRAEALYHLVDNALNKRVPDAKVPSQLKASASIAQTVETAILRSACQWLGVDPDVPIRRQRGRPRTRQGKDGETAAAGEVLELSLQADGSVTGRLLKAFAGLTKDTSLATLTLTQLAELLVALRDAELVDDADMLSAYLEAVDQDWRDHIASEVGNTDGVGQGQASTPWDILGLATDASLSEVKKAYRRIMRTIHPDTSGMPEWYAQTVNDAYRRILEEFNHE